MASGENENPNEVNLSGGEPDQQVMSPRGAHDRAMNSATAMNGIPPPPATGILDMDGETGRGCAK